MRTRAKRKGAAGDRARGENMPSHILFWVRKRTAAVAVYRQIAKESGYCLGEDDSDEGRYSSQESCAGILPCMV